MHIFKVFQLEAAHRLPNVPAGHKCARLHGHSFRVEVALTGTPDPASGWLVDFGEIEQRVAALRDRLDHHLLNEIDGLAVPTLEILSAWIFRALAPALPGLARVTVHRDGSGEACTYRP